MRSMRTGPAEPVIGHLKADHRMDRNYLAHQSGNAVLAAVGYNFRLLLKWLAIFWTQILAAILAAFTPKNQPMTA